MFLYFACILPCIAFGVLNASNTDGMLSELLTHLKHTFRFALHRVDNRGSSIGSIVWEHGRGNQIDDTCIYLLIDINYCPPPPSRKEAIMSGWGKGEGVGGPLLGSFCVQIYLSVGSPSDCPDDISRTVKAFVINLFLCWGIIINWIAVRRLFSFLSDQGHNNSLRPQ